MLPGGGRLRRGPGRARGRVVAVRPGVGVGRQAERIRGRALRRVPQLSGPAGFAGPGRLRCGRVGPGCVTPAGVPGLARTSPASGDGAGVLDRIWRGVVRLWGWGRGLSCVRLQNGNIVDCVKRDRNCAASRSRGDNSAQDFCVIQNSACCAGCKFWILGRFFFYVFYFDGIESDFMRKGENLAAGSADLNDKRNGFHCLVSFTVTL